MFCRGKLFKSFTNERGKAIFSVAACSSTHRRSDNIMAFQCSPPLEPVCLQPLWRFPVYCTLHACGPYAMEEHRTHTALKSWQIIAVRRVQRVHILLAEAMQKRNEHRHFWRSIRQVFLVFGRSGWIGGLVGDILTQQGAKFEFANARLEDRAGILADIERVSCPAQSLPSSCNPAILHCVISTLDRHRAPPHCSQQSCGMKGSCPV